MPMLDALGSGGSGGGGGVPVVDAMMDAAGLDRQGAELLVELGACYHGSKKGGANGANGPKVRHEFTQSTWVKAGAVRSLAAMYHTAEGCPWSRSGHLFATALMFDHQPLPMPPRPPQGPPTYERPRAHGVPRGQPPHPHRGESTRHHLTSSNQSSTQLRHPSPAPARCTTASHHRHVTASSPPQPRRYPRAMGVCPILHVDDVSAPWGQGWSQG